MDTTFFSIHVVSAAYVRESIGIFLANAEETVQGVIGQLSGTLKKLQKTLAEVDEETDEEKNG